MVTSTGAEAVTTASFTPPGGSLLVAMVAHCSSGVSSITMSNTGGTLTWHQLVYESVAAATGSGVFVADIPGGGTNTSPAWAASYDTTAVSGTGTWVNPANAEGAADGSVAVWTAT